MRGFHLALLASTVIFSASAFGADAKKMTDEEIIANATSAAPTAIGKNATVINWDMKELRKGTNGFTCLPDDPSNPTNDPMCVDANGLEWVHALMDKKDPPKGKIGFGYMLQGESAASNLDPFAAAPDMADLTKWSQAGPHVMIFNPGATMTGYPKSVEKPDATQPYVMWGGTPYEHLMIPVQ